jgi:hypothetical protein
MGWICLLKKEKAGDISTDLGIQIPPLHFYKQTIQGVFLWKPAYSSTFIIFVNQIDDE